MENIMLCNTNKENMYGKSLFLYCNDLF